MLDNKFLVELQNYIEDNLTSARFVSYNLESPVYIVDKILPSKMNSVESAAKYHELEDFIGKKRKPSFKQVLFGFIDKMGATDSDIYKKAGIDRRHFSKIRSYPDYHPSKNTAIALSLTLKLNKEETDELLSSAGYSLKSNDTFDLIVQFCIEKKRYEIYELNEALDYFSLEPLIKEKNDINVLILKNLYIVAQNNDNCCILYDKNRYRYTLVNLEKETELNDLPWGGEDVLCSAIHELGYKEVNPMKSYSIKSNKPPMIVATNGLFNVIQKGPYYAILKKGESLKSISKWGDRRILSSKLVKAGYDLLESPKPYEDLL